MSIAKRFFKRNSHNIVFKALAGFGRALNRLYENRNHDIHSNGELTVLKKLAQFNPSVIIDGGANIGKYSLLVNKLIPSATIYAFEPVQDTFQKLQEKIKTHKNIFPIQNGFYKENCNKEINIRASHTHASIYDIQGLEQQSTGLQTINLIMGDDFLDKQGIDNVDFLKIDIEGAEYDALLGFQKHIQNGQVKMIQFEYGYINITTKKLLIDFYSFFEKHGYVVGKIFPKKVEFRPYEFKYEDFLGPNYVAVKKSEIKLIDVLSK